MSIAALQDTFGRTHNYLRISLTERCNLRCRYCMPPEGVDLNPREKLLTFEEIDRLARLFVGLGVDKIRLTGGEPLVRKEVDKVIRWVGAIEGLNHYAITTNGLLLPKKLPMLVESGISQINLSLDTLKPERFEEITLRKGFDLVMKSIPMSLEAGIKSLKINCVLMRGVNDDELVDFVKLTKDLPIEVRFIEYMPFSGNDWKTDLFMSYKEMIEIIEKELPTLTRNDDGPNETSKTYSMPGYAGRVGFITSMSEDFCSGCNRIRLLADGALKVCLFGNAEVSLRDLMRDGASDEDVIEAIDAAINRKAAKHAGMINLPMMENRPMILIGG